jgi:hypothetical protein
MKIITAHKILIVSAILLGLIFGIWSIWQWNVSGDAMYGVIGGLSAVTAISLSFYLRRFMEKADEWERSAQEGTTATDAVQTPESDD